MLFRHRHRHDNSLTSLKEQTHSPKCENTPTLDPKTQAWLKESAALVGPRANGNDGRRRFVLNGQWPQAHDPSLPKRTPTSRKTGFATIRTDSTDSQAAFESDAFAVLMPTTRVPILDQPAASNNTATRAARAEAYKTYQEKAREMRERNDSQGVQVPSKLVTYGSTSTRAAQCTSMQVEISPPNSPARPAGAFPISPPLPQTGWSSPDRSREAPRAERSNICSPRKPVTPTKTTTSPSSHYRVYRTTSDEGESRSQTPSPPTIKIRLRPKQSPQSVRMASTQKIPQITQQHNGSSIRAISPSKSMPNFTRHNSVEGDSIFGYRTKDITGTSVGVADNTSPKATKSSSDAEKTPTKDTAKEKAPKRAFAPKWSWLRSTAPKDTKLAHSTTATKVQPATYIDPFTVYTPPTTTPSCLSPPTHSSPKKLARTPVPVAAHTTPHPPANNFTTGLTQLTTLLSLLFKAGLVLYAVVAIWYVVDAAREAMNAFCAPFRAIRWVGGWVSVVLLWVLRLGMVMWERWGVRVVVKGGWMWKVRWL